MVDTSKAKRRVRIGSSRRKIKVTKPVKTYVKKQINRSIEGREVLNVSYGSSGASYVNKDYPGIPGGFSDVMQLIPRIGQGEARDQRTGAKLKMTGFNCSFFAHIPAALAGNSANAGVTCRLLVLSPKQVGDFAQFNSNWALGQQFNTRYLKNGANEAGYAGDLWSLRWPVNTELFTKHYDKMFTLNRGLRVGASTAGTNVPEVVFNHKFRIKCKNKMLLYPDTTDTTCSNWAPFAILMYCPNDSSISTTSPGPIKGNMFTRITFKP